jgi:hypothetical protein
VGGEGSDDAKMKPVKRRHKRTPTAAEQKAAADMRAVIPLLHRALMTFPHGSAKHRRVMDAMIALTRGFALR